VAPPTRSALSRAATTLALGLGLALLSPTSGVPASAHTEPPSARKVSLAGFPNASTTGAHGRLRVVSGDRTISRDGAVLKDVEIRGSLSITADDVVVRNVKVVSDDFWPVRVTGQDVRLVRSTFVGGPGSQASLSGTFVGRRLNLHGAGDGVKMSSNSSLTDSYIHDLAEFEGAHNDGIEATDAVNARIVHNTILVSTGQTSAIMLSEYGSTPDSNVLVKGNLLGGGGFSLYGGAPDTARGHVVVDNLFTTRFFPRSGYYGPVAYWSPEGNTWENNRWADGDRASRLVHP
jgi:hypothetical protein